MPTKHPFRPSGFFRLALLCLPPAILCLSSQAQTTAFTYQGVLTENGIPATGTYDLRFTLHGDAVLGGFQVGLPRTNSAVSVSNGLFTTIVDFGPAFDHQPRWIELGVRAAGSPGDFATLAPRQAATVSPKADFANRAQTLTAQINEGLLPPSALRRYVNETVTGLYHFAPLAGNPPFTVNSGVLVTNLNADRLDGLDAAQFWQIGGNAGTAPGTHFLGTTDNQPLELRVNGQRALRIEPAAGGTLNWIAGHAGNRMEGPEGARVIGGGEQNVIAAGSSFTTVGGGTWNSIGSNAFSSTIAGGYGNVVAAGSYNSAIGGGYTNVIATNSTAATIGGGAANRISANAGGATLSGGYLNHIAQGAFSSTISGGEANTNAALRSTLGGGWLNQIGLDSFEAVLAGGSINSIAANSPFAAIGGGRENRISSNAPYAAIPGGHFNEVNAPTGFAAGRRAKANHAGAFVWADATDADFASTGDNQFLIRAGGGVGINTTFPGGAALAVNGNMRLNGNLSTFSSAPFELRLGTQRALRFEPTNIWNTINVIIGSPLNRVEGNVIGATIAGGGGYDDLNFADNGNRVTGDYGTVGGGRQNLAAIAEATVAGGRGNTASGIGATVPGGIFNAAAGNYSFAAGYRARANHTGAFVWADATDADFASTANNQFLVRARGGTCIQGGDNWDVNNTDGDFRVGSATHRFKIGVAQTGGGAGDVWMRAHGGTQRLFLKTPGGTTIYSNEGQTSGVTLASGNGSWTSLSDRNAKENFAPVDTREVLEKVAALPLTSWNYKAQDPRIRHLGPMAQDFKAAFGLGESDTGITTVDADGVALAAIQGLNQKTEEKSREGEGRLQKLEAENAALKARLEKLEQLLNHQNGETL